ncbi:uncharacterized protein LOC132617249 [Lycium barbarum]|uniref:uncharacterized protein LOC132617249 n=1 Tax=Lycium barbarum TaxID=112863 RepID=UPI00293F0272|nr:uncharacterized protein LOC132617249 [Lycium barbarum]
MATLQKFKLLATQCAVAASPTRSPTTSPIIHLRRRKTLRMLLSRGGERGSRGGHPSGDNTSPDRISSESRDSPDNKENELVGRSHKLKDLFVSENSRPEFSPESDRAAGSIVSIRSVRPLSATFRQRLLRRVWRPMLVSIPE